MSTSTTFHLFPALPTEIRLKIWSFNLSTPRVIIISCLKETSLHASQRIASSWATATPPPSLLHVNRESRYEALNVYTPCFATISTPRPIYLSFAQDTVKFADGILPYIPRIESLRIQNMVLITRDCAYFGFYNMDMLQTMENLRELELFAQKDVSYDWNNGDRYLNILVAEFEEAREADPGWECPMVRIYDLDSLKQIRFIKGGAKIPGWEPPREGRSSPELEN